MDILNAVPFFRMFSPETRALLVSQAREIRIPQRRPIFNTDDAADAFYLVSSGLVKLSRRTVGGNQFVSEICTPGHVFGELAVFHDGLYPYGADAVEDTVLQRFPLAEFAPALRAHDGVAYRYCMILSGRLAASDRNLEHRTFQSSVQRVGCYILRLVDSIEEDSARCPIPYDKALIALLLGMQPETFSRALARLKEDIGLVMEDGYVDIPDIAALCRLTCTACTETYPCVRKRSME